MLNHRLGTLALATALILGGAACGGASGDGAGAPADGARADAAAGEADGAGGVDGGGSEGAATAIDGAAHDDGGAACKADLTSDPAHCGSCNHDCLGGACAAGVCQPFVMKTNLTVANVRLRMDKDAVYFQSRLASGSSWDLVRVAWDGTATTLLAAYAFTNIEIGLSDADIYLTQGGQLVRMPKTGGASTPVLPQANTVAPLPTATSLFWISVTTSRSSSVWTAPLNGGALGTPVRLAMNLDLPAYTALGNDTLYIADRFNGIIYSVATAASPPTLTTLSGGESMPYGIVADGDEVFWLNKGSSQLQKKPYGSLVHRKVGQAQSDTLVDHITDGAQGLALTKNDVVWITMGGTYFNATPPAGRLMKLPRGGGPPVALLTGLAFPEAVVADEVRVCWLENGPVASDGTGIVVGAGVLKCLAR